SVGQVCVEKSILFRANTPYPTTIIAAPGGQELLFCVQLFFQAGDPILTYFDSSSVLSTLRQPIRMGTSGLCVDGNPAGFLDSKSTSCTRIFANLSNSCITDPALDAASYYRDFTVLKVNVPYIWNKQTPYMKDNMCYNVVSEVIYEIEFNSTHGIQNVSVQFKVTSILGNSGSSLQQHFTLHFWVSAPIVFGTNCGFIVFCQMTILQSQGDGSCSQFLRHQVQFGRNMKTGCKLSLSQMLEEGDCSYVQQKLYKAFQGMNGAEDLAIIGSARSTQAEQWTTILIRNCSVQVMNCSSCCMVPVTLEIQILWSKEGLLSNPQAQILSFLSMSMVPLTTVVTFTDMTEWPEPPRGQPRTYWKLPFDFFFPFKVALTEERNYRDDLAVICYFLLLCI
uniref:Tectonic family member 3 n=1 Tax=Nothoprocta perdicaria TaxID=30464 RepID=A0A8C7EFC8_NOTPE